MKWIEYRLWPYAREVTFQNISLKPDLRTKITLSERRLIAKPDADARPAATSTYYLATWSAQIDSRLKDDFLAAGRARPIHELEAGDVFAVDHTVNYASGVPAAVSNRTLLAAGLNGEKIGTDA